MKWRVDETGTIGTITYTIDTALLPARPTDFGGFVLLVDADGNFSTGAAIYALSPVSGSTYEVTGVDLNDGDYVTIGAAKLISTATGNFNSTSTWANSIVPGSADLAIIAYSHTVTLNTNKTVKAVTINSGGTLNLGSYILTVSGYLVNSGTFTPSTGTVEFPSATAQTIPSLTYYSLKTSGAGTKSLGGNIVVNGDLSLSAGTLDVSTSNYSINIKGNWNNTGGTFTSRNGAVTFNGTSNQTITSNGQTFYNVIINNTATQVSLTGNLKISNVLTLTDGIITTGSDSVVISNSSPSAITGHSAASFVNGHLKRDFISNTSTYSFPVGNGTASTNYFLAEIVNHNLTGISSMYVRFKPLTNHDDADMNVSDDWLYYNSINTAGVWQITPNASPSAGTYDVKLYTANMSGLEDDHFGPLKRPTGSTSAADWSTGGGTLNDWSGTGRMVADGYMLRMGLSGFSDFGGGGSSGSGLPIELLFFNATEKENLVELSWATATEINNDYFTIERSSDGQSFEIIATEVGAGNSSMMKEYYTIDSKPLTGVSYYRLKQTDFDGAFTYSQVVSVNIETEVTINVSPNPVMGETVSIDLSANNDEQDKTITLVDCKGQIVHSIATQSTRSQKVDLSLPDNIINGLYFLLFSSPDEVLCKRLMIER